MKVSHSRMAMFSRCGQQYHYRFNENLRIPPGVALVVGRSVDEAVNADLTAKMAEGALLPAEAVEDIARDRCLQEWEENEVAVDRSRSADEQRGESVDRSVTLSRLHHERVAPVADPVDVQRELRLEIPGVEFIGYLDLQEPEALVDTKTAGRKPQSPPVEQMELYSWAVNKIDGRRPPLLRGDYLVSTKTPKAYRLEWESSPADDARAEARIDAFIAGVRHEAWTPADPDWWGCSARFCGYFHLCPYARRPATVSVNEYGGADE